MYSLRQYSSFRLLLLHSQKQEAPFGKVTLLSLLLLFVVYVQILEEGQFHKLHLLQTPNIADWTSQQVAHWLVGIHLEHHIPEFTAQNINGEQLLQLESSELKVSYVSTMDIAFYFRSQTKLNMFFSAAWSYFLPGPGPDQEENQRP